MNLSQHSSGRPYAKFASTCFAILCGFCTVFSVSVLVLLLWNIFSYGWGALSWEFVTSWPSRFAEKSGIWSALIGSLYLIAVTAVVSVPVGVGAAIYLEEYAPPSRWRTFVQINIANLAGVPSIVYGILGLGLFVRMMQLNRSVIAGGLTLSLVVLPIVILSAQESLRAVPSTIRQASYALGATRWQTIWHQLLPIALPGIMTGVILSLSRALGEAAPLIAIGAATYVRFTPSNLFTDEFSALPIQIFNWTDQPQKGFHEVAAAGIIVLLVVLISMNALAIVLRQRFTKKVRW